MGMDRKRLFALSGISKSSRGNRRIQRQIYGKPKSTERSFRSYIPRAQPHYLSQFFPTQPEMAVYGYPIGQVSHEVFYLRNVDLKSPLSERHPKPSFYHGPIQRCSFSCQRRETIFPCRYHEGSFGRSEIPFIQIFLRQNRRQAL